MKDIFRPLATTTRCKGDSSSTDEVSSDHRSHSNIFRKKRLRGRSISGQCIEESTSLVSFHADAWPPPAMMAVSESTDTKSVASKSSRRKGGAHRPLDRSIPVHVNSADSRGQTPSPHLVSHPLYYKIEIHGSQCELCAGDDNSVQITPEHNQNIQATGPRLRSIDRAAPLAQTRSLESPLIEEVDTSHHHNWAVSDTGAIVKVPNKTVVVVVSETEPEPTFAPTHSPHKPSSSPPPNQNSYYSSLPILTKASSDSASNTSKSSHELLPESPPQVNRTVYEKSLFEESFSRSTSSGKSRSTKAPPCISGSNGHDSRRNSPIIRKVTFSEDMPTNSKKSRGVKEGEDMPNKQKRNACRLDFMSQLWDFVNLTCGTVDCRV